MAQFSLTKRIKISNKQLNITKRIKQDPIFLWHNPLNPQKLQVKIYQAKQTGDIVIEQS